MAGWTIGQWLFFLVFTPPVSIFAIWLGRKYQRSQWLLDKPYAERVAALKLDKR